MPPSWLPMLGDGIATLIGEGDALSGELAESRCKSLLPPASQARSRPSGRTLFLNVHLPPARLVVIRRRP